MLCNNLIEWEVYDACHIWRSTLTSFSWNYLLIGNSIDCPILYFSSDTFSILNFFVQERRARKQLHHTYKASIFRITDVPNCTKWLPLTGAAFISVSLTVVHEAVKFGCLVDIQESLLGKYISIKFYSQEDHVSIFN